MGKKGQEVPKDDDKPNFDPADFLPEEDEEETPEDLDFGDEFEGDDEYDPDDLKEMDPEDDPEPEEKPEGEEEPEEDPEPEEKPEGEEEPEEKPEGEEESEKDPEPEPEPEPEKPRGKPDHMIPKARMDHEVAKRRKLEERIQQLESDAAAAKKAAAEAAKVPEEQIQNWLKDANQKALDGELDEAAQLQSKAFEAMANNRGESEVADAKSVDADQLRSQLKEELKVDSVVEKVFTDYPMLDPNGDSFDEDMNNEVLEYQDFFSSKGYTPSVAVQKAVDMLTKTHDLKPAGYEEPEAPKPKDPERNVDVPVEKKAKAASQQPAEPSSRRGNKAAPEDTVDISQLDDEQYAALPESTKARLRGDI